MPKKILNLRENILAFAKKELLEKGYNDLAMRPIAAGCGIAVGTVYNYFPSKELLAGTVLLEDWTERLEKMRKECADAPDLPAALRTVYDGVSDFASVYRPMWSNYTFSATGLRDAGLRHRMLVSQLADCLKPRLSFKGSAADDIAVFLAENVLICTDDSKMTFDLLLRIVKKLIP